MTIYNSIRRIELWIVLIAIGYIGLMIVTFNLAEEFLSNELSIFDNISNIVITDIFSSTFVNVISGFRYISSIYVIVLISIIITSWIVLKKDNKVKNILFIIFTVL